MIFENWSLHFKDIIASSITNKEVTVRQTDKPWFNGYLCQLLCNRIHHKAKNKTQTLDGHNFVNLETTTSTRLKE